MEPWDPWVDSWFAIAHLTAHGHEFGFMVHYIRGYRVPGTTSASDYLAYVAASIADQTTGWYQRQEAVIPSADLPDGWTRGVDIRTPFLSWSGDVTAMALRATVPGGEINVSVRPEGPALFNNGTGLFRWFNVDTYQFALPNMATSGTLTADGQNYAVNGRAWLDRQWGRSPTGKWTWMGVSLDNGDRLSLWDQQGALGEHAYVTVLHPDRRHEIVAIGPLGPRASDILVVPESGMRYPTHFIVTIQSLRAELDVRTRPQGQALVVDAPHVGPHFEGLGTVTGTYHSREITGWAYAEMVGDWT